MTIKKNILLFSTALILLASCSVAADEVTEPSLVASPVSRQEAQPPAGEPVATEQDAVASEAVEPVSQANSAPEETETLASSQPETLDSENARNSLAPASQSAVASAPVPSQVEPVEPESLSVETYDANVSELIPVTMADVYQMFDDKDGTYTLYIGRPTCHYCRDFSPVIKEFNALTGGQVYYLNTDREDFTLAGKEFLRKKIGVFGTPTILHLEQGEIVTGQVGSGGTAQELYQKLFPKVEEVKPDEDSAVGSLETSQQLSTPQSPVSPSVDTTSSNPSKDLTETLKTSLLSTILKTAWEFIKSWF